MPKQISFQVETAIYSPEIALASGYIMAEWAMIEESVTRLLQQFMLFDAKRSPVSRRFDAIWDRLAQYVEHLYSGQPGEFLEYMRLARQLKQFNGKRDSIAHGVPCTCTFTGKPFQALWIPNWVSPKRPNGIPARFSALKAMAEQMSVFKHEWYWACRTVQWALTRPIQEAQQHPSMRGKQPLPPVDSLLANPLRNPTPTKSPPLFASPLRWPESVEGWQTTSPYTTPKGAVLQMVTAVLLEDVVFGPPPQSSGE